MSVRERRDRFLEPILFVVVFNIVPGIGALAVKFVEMLRWNGGHDRWHIAVPLQIDEHLEICTEAINIPRASD